MTITLEDVQDSALSSELVGTSQEHAIAAFWEHDPYYWETQEPQDVLREFSDTYYGDFETVQDFCEEYLDLEVSDIPSALVYAIDWDIVFSNLQMNNGAWHDGFTYFVGK